MDFRRVRAAVVAGLSPVCGTCSHYWTAQDKGAALCGKDCSGPIAGKAFPEYSGPMTNFERFCFACTSDSDYGIRQPNEDRVIGVCQKHLKLLDRYVPENKGQAVVEVVSGRGLLLPKKGRYTNKSLGEVLASGESGDGSL